MATYKNIDDFFKAFDQKRMKIVPVVVAETATEYYKERFRTKEWDGQRWPETKRVVRRGSLMVRTAKLMSTIRPVETNSRRVRIRAGSPKVPYARIHNEGGITRPRVTAKSRKFAWAKYYETKDPAFKAMALTKKARLKVKIPKRQYIGKSPRLNQRFVTRLTGVLKDI